MKHLVITMADEMYFPNGKLFLETRKRVHADFLLYTPDETGLCEYSRRVCAHHEIDVRPVDQNQWNTMNQSLKFYYMAWNYREYDYVTMCDFDTFFISDWSKVVFGNDFVFGVTTTEGYPQHNYLRSKVNGGVIFLKNHQDTKSMLGIAHKCIKDGGHIDLPQYDQIWKTLEDPKRRDGKRHYRTNHAWWCDQVFLSALVIHGGYNVRAFPCKRFNALDSRPDTSDIPGVYIKHLKSANRIVKKGTISG